MHKDETAPTPRFSRLDLPENLQRVWIAPNEWVDYVRLETMGPGTGSVSGKNPDSGKIRQFGQFFFGSQIIEPVFWAQNTWIQPQIIPFLSINDAARQLKAIQRNWWPQSNQLHRRTQLIQDALPHISRKARTFPFQIPPGDMGSYTLLDDTTLLASACCSSPFPGGELLLEENHVDPPSTAYLKMWEALTRLGRLPQSAEQCIDAGACPGGWTWVLEKCGAEVLALDRSPLSPALMASPRVRFRSGNAFAVNPDNLRDFGWDSVDWLCSDLICYPAKLYEWVKRWFDSGKVKNFVITLKMQGSADWESTRAFAALGGLVYHGCYNKHELTWVWPGPDEKRNQS